MIRLFSSKLFADTAVWTLPVLAFGLTSGIALMVVGGSLFFFTMEGVVDAEFYAILASVALVLLAVPMFSLMSSAAGLMARRRDQRLSTLRLLGATTGQLRGLALTETLMLAAAGIILGTGLYALLLPVVGLLPFGGAPMGVQGLWMGLPAWGISCGALLLVAALASFQGLRRIQVTPLGVRTMAQPRSVHWVRAAIAVGGIILAQILANFTGFQDMVMIVTVTLLIIAVPLLVVQLLGPWVLRLVTGWQLRRAKTAQRLIAARSVLESPQQMWRQIGGVSITTYVGVVAASGMALAGANSGDMPPEEAILIGDVQRGVLLTLAVSFVMAASSVGINQAAQVLDRSEVYLSLAKMGFLRTDLQRIRTLAVMRSLAVVMTVALIAAGLSMFPIIGGAILFAPISLAVAAAVLVAGVLVVRLGAEATRPTMGRVLAPIS